MSFDVVLRAPSGFNVILSDAAPSGGLAKVWNGTAFVEKPVKVWTGSAFVQKPLKFWTGSTWQL